MEEAGRRVSVTVKLHEKDATSGRDITSFEDGRKPEAKDCRQTQKLEKARRQILPRTPWKSEVLLSPLFQTRETLFLFPTFRTVR